MLDILRATPSRIKQWVTPNIRAYLDNRQPVIWTLSLLIGLSVALAAIAFRWLIGVVQLYWLGDTSEQVLSAARNTPWYMILAGPLIGGIVVGVILSRFLPSRRTGGVADVIEARALAGRRLSLREGIISAIATAFSLGAGASAGREGPVIHLGATLASAMGQRLSLPDWSRRTLLAAGVASAISASFNAPIAGVLFAHEVILGHYAMRAFVPIVISSAAGAILSRAWFGDAAAFIVPEYQITSYFEFPAFALLGVVCAIWWRWRFSSRCSPPTMLPGARRSRSGRCRLHRRADGRADGDRLSAYSGRRLRGHRPGAVGATAADPDADPDRDEDDWPPRSRWPHASAAASFRPRSISAP
jgi:CIC family chloride channel protein